MNSREYLNARKARPAAVVVIETIQSLGNEPVEVRHSFRTHGDFVAFAARLDDDNADAVIQTAYAKAGDWFAPMPVTRSLRVYFDTATKEFDTLNSQG